MNFSIEELHSLNGCVRCALATIDAERVILTDHAEARMTERSVTFDEIAEAIRDGHARKCAELGRVEYSIRDVTVVIELEHRGYMRIVTVWKPEHEPPTYFTKHKRKRSGYKLRTNTYMTAEEKANPIELD